METRDPLAILTTHQAAIDAALRSKHIPPDDIEDLRQEVYRRAIQYLAARELTESAKGLLLRIADGVAADYWDKRGIESRAAPRLIEEDVAPSNVEHECNEHEIRRHLAEILEHCDPHGRALVLARYVDEMKVEAIAERFGMPRSTAHRTIMTTLAELAEEFRKRGITSRAVLPFVETIREQGGPAEAAEEARGAASKSEPPVSFSAPVRPSSRPSKRPARHWIRPALLSATSAALGGLIVYLLMQSAAPLARMSPIFVTVAPAAGQPIAPESVFQQPARPLECPPLPVPPAAPAPRRSGPGKPNVDARNRHLARAIMLAEERGDCKTANKLRQELTGAFAAALADRGACTPAP